MPRVAVACDSLMTLRHLGYGGLALSAKGNPIAKASSMVERVYAQSESVEWARTCTRGPPSAPADTLTRCCHYITL